MADASAPAPAQRYNDTASAQLLHLYMLAPTFPDGFPLTQLEAGANPNIRDSSGSTPLHFAAQQNNPDHIHTLIAFGADPNLKNTDKKRTPLHYACQNRKMDAVRALMAHGADPSLPDHEGNTALHGCALWPSSHFDNESDTHLISHPLTDLYALNAHGQTPLELAISNNAQRLAARMAYAGAYIPPSLRNHPCLRGRAMQAQYVWQQFEKRYPAFATADELLHFANIGLLGEALSPSRWHPHEETLLQVFQALHPCHQRHAIQSNPALTPFIERHFDTHSAISSPRTAITSPAQHTPLHPSSQRGVA